MMLTRADQQQHSDMIGVREAIGSLDKRVAVLEAQQANTDTHLRDLSVEVRAIRSEIKTMGDSLVQESRSLNKQFGNHVHQEDIDRIKILRGQKHMMLSLLAAVAIAVLPDLIRFLGAR